MCQSEKKAKRIRKIIVGPVILGKEISVFYVLHKHSSYMGQCMGLDFCVYIQLYYIMLSAHLSTIHIL